MRRRTALASLVLLAAVITAACAQSAALPRQSSGEGSTAGAPAPGALTDQAKRDASAGAAQPQSGIPTFAAVDRNLILTANVSFRSRDPWATADQARAVASGLGGDLLALSQTGSGEQRSAMLTIRVPSSRFDEALAQLKKLEGEVLTSSVDAKDVTEQFVDIQARLSAKKAEEQQYLSLLARANTVDETLKVQSALGSVRTQIEQLQGQVNSMRTRIDYSTIAMAISPFVTAPPAPTGSWDPARTFAQAAAALTALFRVIGDAAIWAVVFLWIPLLALVLTVLATRLRRIAPAR